MESQSSDGASTFLSRINPTKETVVTEISSALPAAKMSSLNDVAMSYLETSFELEDEVKGMERKMVKILDDLSQTNPEKFGVLEALAVFKEFAAVSATKQRAAIDHLKNQIVVKQARQSEGGGSPFGQALDITPRPQQIEEGRREVVRDSSSVLGFLKKIEESEFGKELSKPEMVDEFLAFMKMKSEQKAREGQGQ
jgi:hypothetical protein